MKGNFKKRIVASGLTLTLLLTGISGSVFASTKSYTGTIPGFAGLVTPDESATGKTQTIKPTYVQDNVNTRGQITDTALNGISSTVNLTINADNSLTSGSTSGDLIKARITSSLTTIKDKKINFDVTW
ncbi:hypothetical protein [Caldalkalibacillus mannanilyticus]|uniref:hypothetical protein n=1 Tax=Caldalkalibacillus mannanilyticus TaxID=1418 RepID=UPI00046A1484|nr:hypothetical protein [Caldalkalibacillus mannanilyticus]